MEVTITCTVCGREHTTARYGPRRVRYCSDACRGKAHRTRLTPEKKAARQRASTERHRRWCLANPERALRNSRRWTAKNRDKTRANARRFLAQHPDYSRAKALREKYGLSAAEYDAMLAAQAGLCAACGGAETSLHPKTGKPKRLSVDHCHATGRVRGLLCKACNFAIGHAADDPERLMAAAEYLRRHR